MKSIYTLEYSIMLGLLRDIRLRAGKSQKEIGKALGYSQSLVAKIETGQRRIDFIELRKFCLACGVTLSEFIQEFERRLSTKC